MPRSPIMPGTRRLGRRVSGMSDSNIGFIGRRQHGRQPHRRTRRERDAARHESGSRTRTPEARRSEGTVRRQHREWQRRRGVALRHGGAGGQAAGHASRRRGPRTGPRHARTAPGVDRRRGARGGHEPLDGRGHGHRAHDAEHAGPRPLRGDRALCEREGHPRPARARRRDPAGGGNHPLGGGRSAARRGHRALRERPRLLLPAHGDHAGHGRGDGPRRRRGPAAHAANRARRRPDRERERKTLPRCFANG